VYQLIHSAGITSVFANPLSVSGYGERSQLENESLICERGRYEITYMLKVMLRKGTEPAQAQTLPADARLRSQRGTWSRRR
jgi:hypothetical protein